MNYEKPLLKDYLLSHMETIMIIFIQNFVRFAATGLGLLVAWKAAL